MAGKAKTRKVEKLTSREIKFCQLYIKSNNARQSYIEAGLPGKLPPNSATAGSVDFYACKLLKKSKVKQYLSVLEEHAFKAAQITIEELANDYKSAVDLDLAKLFDKKGKPLQPWQWPWEIRKHVTRMEPVETKEYVPDPNNPGQTTVRFVTRWKVWFENKTACRDTLAKWKRMLSDDSKLDELGVKVDTLQRTVTVNGTQKPGGPDGNSGAGGKPVEPVDEPESLEDAV